MAILKQGLKIMIDYELPILNLEQYKFNITLMYESQIIIWESASLGNIHVGSFVEQTNIYIRENPNNVEEINTKLDFIYKSL